MLTIGNYYTKPYLTESRTNKNTLLEATDSKLPATRLHSSSVPAIIYTMSISAMLPSSDSRSAIMLKMRDLAGSLEKWPLRKFYPPPPRVALLLCAAL